MSRPLSLGTIFLTLYIDLVGFSIIFPLFPSMLEHYLAREGEGGVFGAIIGVIGRVAAWSGGESYVPVLFGGFLGSLYSFLQFAFAPIWGGLSDKRGRRPILLLTCAGTALSYLLWVVSGSFLLLVVARLFGGAMSGNLSVATAAVADVTSRADRAKGMGMVGAAFGLGFVTGPAIGGIFAHIDLTTLYPGLEAWGINPFSVPALAAFVLALVNFFWIAARFRESVPEEARARVEHPVLARDPLKLMRARFSPPVRRTILVHFAFIFAFSGLEFSLAFLARDRFDYTAGQITVMMVFIGAVLILTQGGIVRRIVPLFGENRVALGGLLLVALGFGVISLSANARNVPLLYVGLALAAIGSGCTTPSLTALVSLYTASDRQGQALGAFRSFGALARAIGPIAAAVVFFLRDPVVSYACGGVLVLVSMIVALRLPVADRSDVK